MSRVELAEAQTIRLDLQDVPLEEALRELRFQSGVDIVFAQRLVMNQRCSCRYEGNQPTEALTCVLQQTRIRAERVRLKQYVLVASDSIGDTREGQETEIPRGMLTGFVFDDTSEEILPGAHVYLPDLRLGTVTNDAGYFAIASLPRGSYKVRFSYLGYDVIEEELEADTASVMIRLSPVALESQGVVIEENRNDRVDLSVVPGLVSIPVSELNKLPSFPGEQDLFQTLQWFPGVQKAGEINGELLVRGGSSDQNLYLLDGAPVYHPWHAFSLISTFQTETFKDIKLYRGAFPAEHGGRLTAVLDARMKDGSRTRPRAVGALSLLSGRFIIESPISRNSSFMVSGRRSYLDKLIGRQHPVESPDGVRDTLRTGYYYHDMSVKYTVQSDARHRLSISYYGGGDNLDLRLPFDLSLDVASWLRPADLFFEIYQRWSNRLVGLRYQYLHSRQFFVTATGYHTSYKAYEGTYLKPTSSSELESGYRVNLYDLGVKVEAEYYHSYIHQVQVGIQAVNHSFRSTLDALVQHSPGSIELLNQNSRLQAASVIGYVQDTWQPVPSWKVQPGVRASIFGQGPYASLDPSLNIQYTVFPELLTVRGGIGTQVQYLHRLRDRFSFLYDLVSSRWIPSGKDVKPSSSFQTTLGVEGYPASWLLLAADVYLRESKNILLPKDIYQTKEGFIGPGIDVATILGQHTPGIGKAYGIELKAHAVRYPWQIWIGYAGGRSKNRAPDLGETDFYPSRFDVPRSFTGVVQWMGNRWDVTLSSEIRSGYPHSVPVATYFMGDPLGSDEEATLYLHRPFINNGRLPAYARVDLTVAYRFRLLGAQWRSRLQIYNITNRRNVISRQYDPTTGTVRVSDRRGLPILPLLELEMEL